MYVRMIAATQPADVSRLRDQLAGTLPGLVAGAAALRAVDLGGDDWRAQLDAASRASGAAWRPSYATLKDVRAGAAQLDASPLGAAARAAIDAALLVADRGLDSIGRAYMQYSVSPTPQLAAQLVTFVAGRSDRTAAAITDVIVALDALLGR